MSTAHDDGEESKEYQYDDMSPVRRYYNDIHDDVVPPIKVVISFENLLKAQGMIETGTPLDNLTARILSISETHPEPRHVRELYMLLPFEIIAPYVDMTLGVDAQEKWYKDAVNHTKSWLTDDHSDACIEDMDAVSPVCSKSPACPMIVMNHLLVGGVYRFDFDDAPYVLDPMAAYDSASMKLKVAKLYGLTDKKLAAFQQEHYDVAFAARFPQEIPVATPEEQVD